MTQKSDYIDELKGQLRRLETSMASARQRLEAGALKDRPDAAGDLAVLESRHGELAARIAEAEKDDAEDWSNLHSGLQEQIDGIRETLSRMFGPTDRGDS